MDKEIDALYGWASERYEQALERYQEGATTMHRYQDIMYIIGEYDRLKKAEYESINHYVDANYQKICEAIDLAWLQTKHLFFLDGLKRYSVDEIEAAYAYFADHMRTYIRNMNAKEKIADDDD